MPVRILHVSDLHVGAHEDEAVQQAIAAVAAQVAPELVIATGDLTHSGRRDQHERAARFLRALGPPVLAVPGNHDIPRPADPARALHPWREFERLWETTEPVYASSTLVAVGLNSVRPWRYQSGAVREEQLARAEVHLLSAPASAVCVVALHHHMVGAPWRSWKRPVSRRNHVLARLVDSGADLILGGHIHQAAVSERREFEVVTSDAPRAVVVSIAPGLGQPRPDRRGEARGFHAYAIDDEAIEVHTHVWHPDGFRPTAVRRFPRTD